VIRCDGLELAQRGGLVPLQEFLLLGLKRLAELLKSHQNLCRLRKRRQQQQSSSRPQQQQQEEEEEAAVSVVMGRKDHRTNIT
jgi:Sec-independent protein translocase protein TatA